VYPRAADGIRNFTELLDLNFNVLESVVRVEDIRYNKLSWLKRRNYHLEIDETKREKYVREAERWFKFILYNEETIANELASLTSKNAWLIASPYHVQLYYLNLFNERNYPLSCHLVKRPFAHQFDEFYFFTPKAEECKW
jgi:hypothetical protein